MTLIVALILSLSTIIVSWVTWQRERKNQAVIAAWEAAGKTVHFWRLSKMVGRRSLRAKIGGHRYWLSPLVLILALAAGVLFAPESLWLMGTSAWVIFLGLGNLGVGFGARAMVTFTDEAVLWYGQIYRWEDMERSDYSDGTQVYRYQKSTIACIRGKASELCGEPWDSINQKLRFIDLPG